MKKGVKRVLLILIIMILVGAGIWGVMYFFGGENPLTKKKPLESSEPVTPPKKVEIVDLKKKDRPIAIMINNNHDAWPQSGLKNAYMIYEIMVEGGITRMMALFTQDAVAEKIGSIRSSRHNYLDYVMENDAIYIHWGGSDKAYSDLNALKLDRIDGMVYGNKYFITDKTLKRSLEHTRFSSLDMIRQGIADRGFRTTTDNGYLLNYTTDEVDLSQKEGSQVANNVVIKYSSYQTSSYEYNSEEKVYYRSMNDTPHTDLVTGEQYHFKNIIAYAVQYNSYQGTKLQDLQNIGSGEGVYITNGYSVPIKWSKTARDAKTKYTYLDGTEIDVSDGNTFIQIYPKTGSLTIN